MGCLSLTLRCERAWFSFSFLAFLDQRKEEKRKKSEVEKPPFDSYDGTCVYLIATTIQMDDDDDDDDDDE